MSEVLLLTDRSQLPPGRDLVECLLACAGAGLRSVVVREHDLPAAARASIVARVSAASGLRVLVSRTPVPGAAGVHLASHQGGPGLGRSCHDLDGVRRAVREARAYATLSPFAASASKPGYGPALASATYAAAREVAAGSDLRVLALGGVDVDNAADAVAAGAHGVAVMGAVMRSHDPAATTAALLAAVGAP